MSDSFLSSTITAKELGRLCGVSSETALRWAAEGRVEHLRIGGRIRFPANAAESVIRVIPARAES